MEMWQNIGVALSPLKRFIFRVLSRIHRTTRPRILIVCGEEFLVVRNWGDKKWSLPGGGMHRGESLAHAAARECTEELGIKVPENELELLQTIEQKTYTAPVFIWKIDKKPAIKRQKLEITGVKWLMKEEFRQPLTGVSDLVRHLIF